MFLRSLFVLCLAIPIPVPTGAEDAASLGERLEPFLSALGGRDLHFAIEIELEGEIEKQKLAASLAIERSGEEAFVFEVEHKEYAFRIERTADRTTILVPGHKAAFVGTGAVNGPDTLAPKGLASRLFSQDSAVFPFANVITGSTGPLAARLLTGLAGLKSTDGRVWTAGSLGDATITFAEGARSFEVRAGSSVLKVSRVYGAGSAQRASPLAHLPDGILTTAVDRTELERVLVRAPRRALEVLAPGPQLADPPREPRKAPHGEVRWVDGMRPLVKERRAGAAFPHPDSGAGGRRRPTVREGHGQDRHALDVEKPSDHVDQGVPGLLE